MLFLILLLPSGFLYIRLDETPPLFIRLRFLVSFLLRLFSPDPFSLFFSKFRFPSDGSESTSTSSVIYNPSSSLLSSLFSPVLLVSPYYICYPSLLHQQMYYLGTCISIIHTLVLFFRSSLPYVYYSLVLPPPTRLPARSSFGFPPHHVITSSPSGSSLDPIPLPCRFLSSIQYPSLAPSDYSDSSPLFMFSHT